MLLFCIIEIFEIGRFCVMLRIDTEHADECACKSLRVVIIGDLPSIADWAYLVEQLAIERPREDSDLIVYIESEPDRCIFRQRNFHSPLKEVRHDSIELENLPLLLVIRHLQQELCLFIVPVGKSRILLEVVRLKVEFCLCMELERFLPTCQKALFIERPWGLPAVNP